MAKTKRKFATPVVKTADEALFKLHDKFCRAYNGVLFAKRKDPKGNGSLPSGTKYERAAHREWEREVSKAVDCARAVIDEPALTLEGMLMKIHVAGYAFPHTNLETFSAPYHGLVCSNGKPQQWEGHANDDDEAALIVSLRADLLRLAGRRA